MGGGGDRFRPLSYFSPPTQVEGEWAVVVAFIDSDAVDKLVYIHGMKNIDVSGVSLEIAPHFET